MNIANTVDKIIKESTISPGEYTVVDRLVDIHQTRLELQELRMQISPRDTIRVIQAETVVAGDQTFARDVKHVDIVKVEWRLNTDNRWQEIEKEVADGGDVIAGRQRYSYDIDNLLFKDMYAGLVQVTYSNGDITEWVEADYTTGTAVATELPAVYRKLLWLTQAVRHVGYYDQDRFEIIKNEYDELYVMYVRHLRRDVETEEYLEDDEPNSKL